MMFHKYWGIKGKNDYWYEHLSEIRWSPDNYLFKLIQAGDKKCSAKGQHTYPLSQRSIDWENEHDYKDRDYDSPSNYRNKCDNFMYIEGIVEICADRDIDVIFVTFPYYHKFRKKVTKRSKAERTNFISKFLDLGDNVYYYDFIDDPRFSDSDFWNASHLNEEGAMKFTQIFKNEVMSNF